MKKRFTFLIAALAAILMMAQPDKVMGQASVGTTMWAETWTGATTATSGSNSATPSANYGKGTTVYNSGTVTYSQSANSVYVRNESTGGGTAPELLLSGNQTWTISNIPTGNATELTLTYKSNNTRSSVTCSTDGVTITGSSKSYTITPNGAETITLVFSSTSNTRIDDVSLTVKTAGSSDEATSVVIDHSEVKNNIYGDNTDGGSFSATVLNSSDEEIGGATVSWSSSNTDVASIDSSTGAVTLRAVGSTTITASYAGSSGSYQSSFATYTLTVVNENPAIKTIWSEDFSDYSANDVPSGGTYSYACTDGNGGGTTKVYAATNAGGTSPELLVAKSSGTFTATIPLLTSTYGYSGDLTLKYKQNANSLNVKTITSGITVEGEASEGTGITNGTAGEKTITFKGVTTLTENITIVFTATTGSNVRLDDILLKGEQAALTKVATPVITPASGAVANGTEVTITCATEDASIYYTMGATPADPDSNSEPYDPNNKPTITEGTTIKAIAVKNGLMDSEVATVTYTIAEPCATPTFSVAAGEVDKGTTVTISTETAGATIYYTTDGTSPTTSSTTYSSAITINSAMTIKAIAVKEGYANSELASATYTVIDYATLPFIWAGGTSSALTALTGVTASGLGTDYAQQNAPYRVKFDTDGDNILIKTNEQPAVVKVGIKKFAEANTSSLVIQGSSDGKSFTDVQTFSVTGTQNATFTYVTTNAFATTDRYVRIYLNKPNGGSNVGVGPISIYKNKPAPFVDENYEIESDVTIGDGEYLIISSLIKIPNGKKITVSNKGVLVNTTAANLVIEEGGQLIINSESVSKDGVQATFQREVVGYGSSTGKDKYILLANPTKDNIDPNDDVAGMLDNNYDLYYFDEAQSGEEWRNYKQKAFNLENGKGYLYANSSNRTLNFPGTVPTGTTASITLSKSGSGDYTGFNLVGNPLSNNITSMNIEGAECEYYKLDSEGAFVVSNEAIIVGEAFMVEAPKNGDKLYLNTTPPPSGKDEAGFTNEVIRLEVSNSKFTDVAYVYFGNHLPLTKINHLNDEAPMLYIHNENSDKAVEVYNNRGEVKSINVNFEAKTIGTYTISAKMVKGEIKYMHLYDRFTGIDTDLLIDDYSFIGANEDQPGRFILKLEAIDNEFEGSDNFAYQSGNNIMVNGEGELQIFDVMGRLVMNERINGVEAISGLSRGIYIFRVIGETQKTQKIVVR